MNSGFIRLLRQSTRKMAKGRKTGSGVMIPIMYMSLVLVCILVNYNFRRSQLQYNYENIESCLTQALLAGGVINLHEYARNGRIMIQESCSPKEEDRYFGESYTRFLNSIRKNLALDDGDNVTSAHGIKGHVRINDYRVFNYIAEGDGFYIIEIGTGDGNTYIVKHGKNEHVYVYANDMYMDIDRTSVYAEMEFTLGLTGYTSWIAGISENDVNRTYTLKRLVSVVDD